MIQKEQIDNVQHTVISKKAEELEIPKEELFLLSCVKNDQTEMHWYHGPKYIGPYDSGDLAGEIVENLLGM